MSPIGRQLCYDAAILVFTMVFTALFTIAVLDAVYPPNVLERGVKTTRNAIHLPTKCKEYYSLGTDEWNKCMGVEKK
jgi:hypothetical protein